MSWEFFVGQKVVCVDDGTDTSRFADDVSLCRGEIYTIRQLMICEPGVHGDGGLCLFLNEVQRPYCNCCGEVIPWAGRRFHPLQSKAISLFRSIAQGVTDGKPVVPDEPMPVDEPVMPEFVGRPLMLGRQ